MKPLNLITTLFAATALITGCISSERNSNPDNIEENMVGDDALLVTVLETKSEKDGYSLTVEDMAGKTYQAVISIPNLGRDSTFDFGHIKVGNQLRLKGEYWDMAGVPQITARHAEYVGVAGTASTKHCSLKPAGDINLWINAMPSPNGPILIAIFQGTTPTPGYEFKGKVVDIQESDPPSYVIDIVATPPSGIVAQVVTTAEVRLDIPIESSEAHSVTLTCQGQTLFTVNHVMTAH